MPFINVMTNSEIKDKNALKSELGNAITRQKRGLAHG